MTFQEFIQLFLLNLKVKLNNFIQYLRVIVKYYPDYSFFKIDSYLILSYLFNSPFKISKRFLMQRGESDLYTYGETPLTTLEKIALECQFSSRDTVFELGCGRGRTCFWLNQFIRCAVVGVDYVPEFIERANRVKHRFHLSHVQFRLEDFLQSDLTGATIVYLYGTCLEGSLINSLIDRFETLPKGTKIITVSYTLQDYTAKPLFDLVKSFPAQFTWGVGDVYLHIRK